MEVLVRRLSVVLAVAVSASTVGLGLAVPASATTASAATASAAPAPYTVTPLRIQISSPGCPTPALDPTYQPTVAADLYVPSPAPAVGTAPAILTTNGFGGSKADQAGLGKAFAARGYVVLSYSGLGFGGSSCRITLDDRQHDGAVGSQLVSFLGGDPAIKAYVDTMDSQTGAAAYDSTKPVVLDTTATVACPFPRCGVNVKRDNEVTHDPRVGMIGGSYGGQIQFATAAVDKRVDTIVPIITWNDLSYSLTPNNTTLQPNSVSYATPGVGKLDWTGLFFADGQAQGLKYAGEDLSERVANPLTNTCPEFDPRACTALTQETTDNAPNATTLSFLRQASVHSYLSQIKIPTFLAQGQSDTLFNLQESVANYRQLKAQGTPVKLLWQSWGHSNSTPVAGELDLNAPTGTYEGGLFEQWFDHYLKDNANAPALDFSYFRDYAYTAPNAAAAYQQAPAYPVGTTQQLFLSSAKDLTPNRSKVTTGTGQFATPGASGPLSQSYTAPNPDTQQPPATDAPGTFAAYDTQPLTTNVDSVGIPTLDVRLSSPTAEQSQALGPKGDLIMFAKIYDVAPDNSTTLVHRLIAPVRVADVTKPLHIELPGVVHRYATGHKIRLVLAASDVSYQNNRVPQVVSVLTDRAAPGVLTVPVLAGQRAFGSPQAGPGPAVGQGSGSNGSGSQGGTGPSQALASPSSGALAATGGNPLLPLVSVVAVGLAIGARRLIRSRSR